MNRGDENFRFVRASIRVEMNAGRTIALKNETGVGGSGARGPVAEALREHAAVLGRVCMALIGERDAATRALERVARDAGEKGLPEGGDAKVFLLGLAHRACTTQLSKMPVRTAPREDRAPATERMGEAAAAGNARTAIAKLKPTEREALVLHVVGGLDAPGVAAACGLDPKVAKERIGRALAQVASDVAAGTGAVKEGGGQ
jgi:RNA polymerase sigma-70 factor, ECF subfamily